MSWSRILVAVVGVIYLATAASYLWEREWQMAGMFFCYALANVFIFLAPEGGGH